MSATLYLLRQKPDRISPSLFRASDEEIDVVFIEQAVSIVSSGLERAVVSGEGITVGGSHSALTYDDLVEKIFSSEHIIVL
jgi:hypothetical protein